MHPRVVKSQMFKKFNSWSLHLLHNYEELKGSTYVDAVQTTQTSEKVISNGGFVWAPIWKK